MGVESRGRDRQMGRIEWQLAGRGFSVPEVGGESTVSGFGKESLLL